MNIVESLKALGTKLVGGDTAVSGESVAEVLEDIESKYTRPGDGTDGKSVTAITFTKSNGEITGGTATLSDNSTITITVTEA